MKLEDLPTSKDEAIDLLESKIRGKKKNWFQKFIEDLSKAPAAKQMAVGGLSGWCAGFIFSKFGKVAATAVGGSLLLIQIAQHQGYIEINWRRVNRDMENASRQLEKRAKKTLPRIIDDTQKFINNNILIVGGFAGGFLLGVASG